MSVLTGCATVLTAVVVTWGACRVFLFLAAIAYEADRHKKERAFKQKLQEMQDEENARLAAETPRKRGS